MRPIIRCLTAVFALVLLSLSYAGVLASRIDGIQANMLVNGDFENSSFNPGACLFNWPNAGITASVPGITAYGALNAIDFTKVATSCGFGPPPQSGVAKLTIERASLADEFSIGITGGVVAGTAYTLTFYASLDPIPQSIAAVEIGLSNNASAFGTLVYTSPTPSTTGWTAMSTSFEAPVNASYLTMRVATGTPGLIHLDNVSLEPVTTDVPHGDAVAGFGLIQLSPSPGTWPVRIEYALERESHVTIDVFDLQGRQVEQVLDEVRPAGRHVAVWNPRPSERTTTGVYLVHYQGGGRAATRKLLHIQ